MQLDIDPDDPVLNPTRPYFYLLAYVVVLYLRPQEYVPALVGSPLVPVLLLFAFAFWAVAQHKDFEAPQHGLLVGLVAAIFLSVARADGVGSAVVAVQDFVPTVLLFIMVSTSVDSVGRFQQIAWVLTGLAALIAVHGIEQFANESGVGWTGAKMIEGRITYLGYLNDPNDLAMAFLMVLPLAVMSGRAATSMFVRWPCYAAAAIILYGTFLCNSRGSMLGVLAMVGLWAVRRYGLFRSAVVIPPLIVLLLAAAPSRVSEMSADEESAAGRIDAWYEGFEMLRSHPFIGVGKGLFIDHNYLTAHNSFVLAIAELGLIGYFFWLSILVVSIAMLARLLGPEPPKAELVERPDRQLLDGRLEMPAMTHEEQAPDESTAPSVGGDTSWMDIQLVASALAYSLLGTIVAAFFLSRSYVNFLYLLVALIVAVFGTARRKWPGLAPFQVSGLFGTLVAFELGSIVFLWGLTKVLLAFD